MVVGFQETEKKLKISFCIHLNTKRKIIKKWQQRKRRPKRSRKRPKRPRKAKSDLKSPL
jgi:hypothetical protein